MSYVIVRYLENGRAEIEQFTGQGGHPYQRFNVYRAAADVRHDLESRDPGAKLRVVNVVNLSSDLKRDFWDVGTDVLDPEYWPSVSSDPSWYA